MRRERSLRDTRVKLGLLCNGAAVRKELCCSAAGHPCAALGFGLGLRGWERRWEMAPGMLQRMQTSSILQNGIKARHTPHKPTRA